MPKFLEFDDEASAVARSRQEALDRGCAPDAGTQYWWPVYRESEGKFLLPVENDTPGAAEERNPRFDFVERIK